MATYVVSEKNQLNMELAINNQGLLQRSGPHTLNTLPGQPRVRLGKSELFEYLRSQFLVPQLDELAGKLWLVSCMPSVAEYRTEWTLLAS